MTNLMTYRSPPARCRPVAPVALADLHDLSGEVDMGKSELTPAEAAEVLGVSPATVRRWDARGILVPSRRLPGSGHRRYSRQSVEALKAAIESGESVREE